MNERMRAVFLALGRRVRGRGSCRKRLLRWMVFAGGESSRSFALFFENYVRFAQGRQKSVVPEFSEAVRQNVLQVGPDK